MDQVTIGDIPSPRALVAEISGVKSAPASSAHVDRSLSDSPISVLMTGSRRSD